MKFTARSAGSALLVAGQREGLAEYDRCDSVGVHLPVALTDQAAVVLLLS